MIKKIKFTITGIHCQSCKTLIETEVSGLAGVKKINVNHLTGETMAQFDADVVGEKEIFTSIEKLNYSIVSSKQNKDEIETNIKQGTSATKIFLLGFLVPVVVIGLIFAYFYARSLGGFEIMAGLNDGQVGYGLILLIGILAGFHCVGMCGGLVVAYSAKNLENRNKSLAPHFQYNLGRFISYSIIGGILGGVGSFFAISPSFTGAILLIASAFMVIMGLSFIFNWAILDKLKLRTPQFIARYLYSQKKNGQKGPFIIGLLNGFMPCGPLQAMQLYALTVGSVIAGATSMAIYALGTIPMMFGFGAAISTIGHKKIKNMIKFSGVLIVILALFMANRGLTSLGYGFSGQTKPAGQDIVDVKNDGKFQEIEMELTYFGYKPNVLTAKKDVPIRWIINVKEMSGCTNAIMIESLGIKKNLQYGRNVIEFTPPKGATEIKFSCWMRMVWGKFVLTD